MAKRIDANHGAVVVALRRLGWHVVPTFEQGGGFPDLLCAKAGRLVQIEVKDGSKPPSARKLTPDEQRYHSQMELAGCPVVVIERIEQIERL